MSHSTFSSFSMSPSRLFPLSPVAETVDKASPSPLLSFPSPPSPPNESSSPALLDPTAIEQYVTLQNQVARQGMEIVYGARTEIGKLYHELSQRYSWPPNRSFPLSASTPSPSSSSSHPTTSSSSTSSSSSSSSSRIESYRLRFDPATLQPPPQSNPPPLYLQINALRIAIRQQLNAMEDERDELRHQLEDAHKTIHASLSSSSPSPSASSLSGGGARSLITTSLLLPTSTKLIKILVDGQERIEQRRVERAREQKRRQLNEDATPLPDEHEPNAEEIIEAFIDELENKVIAQQAQITSLHATISSLHSTNQGLLLRDGERERCAATQLLTVQSSAARATAVVALEHAARRRREMQQTRRDDAEKKEMVRIEQELQDIAKWKPSRIKDMMKRARKQLQEKQNNHTPSTHKHSKKHLAALKQESSGPLHPSPDLSPLSPFSPTPSPSPSTFSPPPLPLFSPSPSPSLSQSPAQVGQPSLASPSPPPTVLSPSYAPSPSATHASPNTSLHSSIDSTLNADDNDPSSSFSLSVYSKQYYAKIDDLIQLVHSLFFAEIAHAARARSDALLFSTTSSLAVSSPLPALNAYIGIFSVLVAALPTAQQWGHAQHGREMMSELEREEEREKSKEGATVFDMKSERPPPSLNLQDTLSHVMSSPTAAAVATPAARKLQAPSPQRPQHHLAITVTTPTAHAPIQTVREHGTTTTDTAGSEATTLSPLPSFNTALSINPSPSTLFNTTTSNTSAVSSLPVNLPSMCILQIARLECIVFKLKFMASSRGVNVQEK